SQTQFLAESPLHLESFFPQRGQGASRTGELADQNARLELIETFRMAVEHREPDGSLVSERDRQGLLQVGTSRHGSVPVFPRQFGQDAAQCINVLIDDA